MQLITENRFKKTKKYIRAIIIFSIISIIIGLLAFGGILLYAKVLGPPPLAVPQSTLYYSADHTIIGESNSGEKRYWVPLTEISPYLVQATISVEDRNFYEHNGFDYRRIAGAVLADVKAMAKVQGASTISQQYARNLFLHHGKTWERKALEAFYTVRLETNYSKNQLLEGYLNTIYYGHGAYGIEAASHYYFGKSAKELTLSEASLLAGIPKGPSHYSPFVSLEKAKERQAIILNTMVANGYISKQLAEQAKVKSFTFHGKHQHAKIEIAPYFQDAVRYELKTKLGLDDRLIELGGLRIFTTLDLQQQKIAEETIQTEIANGSEIQVGFVSMDPENGHILALVGGRDYKKSNYNRAIQAVRQPGSTIKPLLYYAALEQGFTPSTTMRSELTTFQTDEGRSIYTPHNFNNKYADKDITLVQALALSDNVYAVKTHLFLGEDSLVDTAKQFGLTTKMAAVPSLALGTSGVRMIEMVNAYSLFANGGKKVQPTFIKRVENYNGEVIFETKQPEEEVLQPELAYVMTQMMTGMFDPKLNGYASVTGSTVIKEASHSYAGKSGSTDTDSWMIGFSPKLVSGVWTGYDQNKPIVLTAEKSYSKNIWIQFMEQALKDQPTKQFQPPKGTQAVYVNPANGKLATKNCPVKRLTYFKTGTEPTEYCTDHIDQIKEKEKPRKNKPNKEKPWYKKIWNW